MSFSESSRGGVTQAHPGSEYHGMSHALAHAMIAHAMGGFRLMF